jgi:hypothetical protein
VESSWAASLLHRGTRILTNCQRGQTCTQRIAIEAYSTYNIERQQVNQRYLNVSVSTIFEILVDELIEVIRGYTVKSVIICYLYFLRHPPICQPRCSLWFIIPVFIQHARIWLLNIIKYCEKSLNILRHCKICTVNRSKRIAVCARWNEIHVLGTAGFEVSSRYFVHQAWDLGNSLLASWIQKNIFCWWLYEHYHPAHSSLTLHNIIIFRSKSLIEYSKPSDKFKKKGASNKSHHPVVSWPITRWVALAPDRAAQTHWQLR